MFSSPRSRRGPGATNQVFVDQEQSCREQPVLGPPTQVRQGHLGTVPRAVTLARGAALPGDPQNAGGRDGAEDPSVRFPKC